MNNPALVKPFVTGQFRAASADISAQNEQNFFALRSNNFDDHPKIHARQNSVDNSLVSPTETTKNKPAVPAKPVGIVSVFVSGNQTANKSTRIVSHSGEMFDKSHNLPVLPPRKVSLIFGFVFGFFLNLFLFQKPNEPVHQRRCVAMYDCEADQPDELSFRINEIIVVTQEKTNDEEWMEGIVESDPSRRGLFPAVFVKFI